jgi:hypothetical protein
MTGWNTLIFLLATAGALGLAACWSPGQPASPQPFISDEPAPLPLAPVVVEIPAGHHGHYVTTATIDHMPVAVLVDTGASKVALSYDDADRIGLNPFVPALRSAGCDGQRRRLCRRCHAAPRRDRKRGGP